MRRPTLCVVVPVAAVLALCFYDSTARARQQSTELITGLLKLDDALGGPPSAASVLSGALLAGSMSSGVVLVEYGDFRCLGCVEFARSVLPRLRLEYLAKGKLGFAFQPPPSALLSADAATDWKAVRCAATRSKEWLMHDQLFMGTRTFTRTGLVAAARSAGLQESVCEECLDRPAESVSAVPRRDVGAVTQLPAFFLATIDDHDRLTRAKPMRWPMTFAALAREIDLRLPTKRP